jgi:GDSL-like Lipase/Acylhydrolase family
MTHPSERRTPSYPGSCYSTATGQLIAQDAYSDAETIQITPTASSGGVVTAFKGSLSVTGTPNAVGTANNCNPSYEVITFTGTLPEVFAALGDSYSSGEGLPPFLPGSDTQGNLCHRSAQAYSQVFAANTNSTLRMEFHACSGASPETSWAVPNPDQTNPAELPQRDWLGQDVALVTMTYGGNDLNWPSTLLDCTKVQLGVFHTTVYGNPSACNADLDAAPQEIESMYQNLLTVYLDALHGVEREDPRPDVSAAIPAAADVELRLRHLLWSRKNNQSDFPAHRRRRRGEALCRPGTAGEPRHRQRGEPG